MARGCDQCCRSQGESRCEVNKRQPAEIKVRASIENFLTQIGVSLERKIELTRTGEGKVSGTISGVVTFDLDIDTFLVMTETDIGKPSHSGAA